MRTSMSLAMAAALTFTISVVHAEPCSSTSDCTAAPAAPPQVIVVESSRTPTRMRSIPLFVTGVVLDTIGAAGVGLGIGAIVMGASYDCDGADRFGESTACRFSTLALGAVGAGAIAVGGVFLGIGIPLTAAGATSVPDIKKATAMPSVRIAGAGGSLEWKF